VIKDIILVVVALVVFVLVKLYLSRLD